MKDIKPSNLEQEREKFFNSNCNYNPQFEYCSTLNLENQTLPQPHKKYIYTAMKIINKCNQEFGNFEDYMEKDGGELMTKEQTEDYLIDYIQQLQLQDLITYEFALNTVAATSVIHSKQDQTSKVIIGLPIAYRKNRIQGVFDHEIGTHFIRKFNEKKQVWHKCRNKYNLQPHIKNEEGLALLNQMTSIALNPSQQPYIYRAAIHYIAAIMASEMSFSELYQELGKYLSDKDKRFQECLRVKRGLTDTSQHGGCNKVSYFLRNFTRIKFLKYRKKLNFIDLHSGKITVKDCIRLSEKGLINREKIMIPYFLKNMDAYMKALDRIAEVNLIE